MLEPGVVVFQARARGSGVLELESGYWYSRARARGSSILELEPGVVVF